MTFPPDIAFDVYAQCRKGQRTSIQYSEQTSYDDDDGDVLVGGKVGKVFVSLGV